MFPLWLHDGKTKTSLDIPTMQPKRSPASAVHTLRSPVCHFQTHLFGRLRPHLRQAFLGSQHVIRLSDFHAKRLALLDGVGFGWLPLHLAEADLARGELVLLDLPEGNRWTYQPQLITRRDAALGRAASLFIALLLGEDHQKN